MTRSRLSATLLLLAVLMLGAVLGGVAVSVAEHRGKVPGRQGHGREGFLSRLTEQLDLSGPQQDSIRGVLSRYDPAMDSMWREVRPRFDSLRTVVRAEIRSHLNQDQQRMYTEMLEKRDREYRQRRANDRR